MPILQELAARHAETDSPLLLQRGKPLRFSQVAAATNTDLSSVRPGDVVALIGDFEAISINTLLRLIDIPAIVAPLSPETRPYHDDYFESAGVDVVIEGTDMRRLRTHQRDHEHLKRLRDLGHPGLILYSSGTTGRPKAILHDFERFLVRYRTPRPALRTLNFLLFDHIGGINTLFHTMYNRGQVVIPSGRTPQAVLEDMAAHRVELLPTTPTFLRMLLLSGLLTSRPEALASLRIVSYGTEAMDPSTLQRLCALLPSVDFRQTYGMSELGILRVKSRARDSLWMQIGGEGVTTRVDEQGVLHIASEFRMIGYLNAASPFIDGWYDTGDVVEVDGPYVRVVGRSKLVINVGGVKVQPSEIERVALTHPEIALCHVEGKPNPITGQHIELTCQLQDGSAMTRGAIRGWLSRHLPPSVMPHRVRIGAVGINHRFKKQ